jgi:hypothetical protein
MDRPVATLLHSTVGHKTSQFIVSVKAFRVVLKSRHHADRNNSPLGYGIWIYRKFSLLALGILGAPNV